MSSRISASRINLSEHQIQRLFFNWVKFQYPEHFLKKRIFKISNEGKRSFGAATYFKQEGLVAGIADICIRIPKGIYHGMYIEMKSENGRLSEEQKIFLDDCVELGYKAVTCHSFEEAKQELEKYLGK